MPKQDPDTEGNLLGPFDHHVDDVVEVAIEEDSVSQVWTGRSIELLVYPQNPKTPEVWKIN